MSQEAASPRGTVRRAASFSLRISCRNPPLLPVDEAVILDTPGKSGHARRGASFPNGAGALALLGLWLALARPAGGHEQRFTRALVVQVAPESLDVAVEVQLPAGTRAAIMTHYFDRDRSARLEPAEQALLAASLARRGLAGVVLGNTRSGAVFDLGRGLRAALRAGGGGASSTGWPKGGAPMLGPPFVGPRGASLLALGVTHLLDLRPGQRLALRLRLAEGVEPLGVTVQAMPGACVAAVSRGAIGPDGAAVLGALRAGDVVDFEVVAGACR